jgi:hypothetical protein
MEGSRTWKIWSFLFCFLCNGILIAFFLGSETVLGKMALPVKAAAGGILTLILWLLVVSAVPRQARQTPVDTVPLPGSEGRLSLEGVVQMLAVLQREGRLIDFLQEDLTQYEDGQIGAAVRSIHTGCKEALKEHMEIRPVFDEKEGTRVTVPPGFDPGAIRLSGNVTGNPPFRGILRHRGWQVERIRLPQSADHKDNRILAPAEVEVE